MGLFVAGRPLALPPSSFVADGGEATLHAVADTAYKVFRQPVDPDRLQALRRLAVPGALLPERLIRDHEGTVVGHTMPFLADAVPLTRLLARSWRERHAITPDRAVALVEALRDRVRAVHRAGAQVVDLHSGNVLLDAGLMHPTLIDTSSWQLPGFPATAILDAVRDRHAVCFDEGTDWFAFAVLATQLLLGLHPYRGTHPTVKGLDERMTQRLSVFRPEVRRPAATWPLDVVPPRWRAWLQAVLDGPERGAPPKGAEPLAWSPAPLPGTRRLALVELARADQPLLGALEVHGCTIAWHAGGLVGGPPGALDAVAISPGGHPVGAVVRDGRLRLCDLRRDREVPLQMDATTVVSAGACLQVLTGGRVLELRLVDLPDRVLVTPRLLASVLPHATELRPGLLVERLPGGTHLSLLSSGRCERLAAPVLDGATVLEASHRRGVIALTLERRGQLERLVWRVHGGRVEQRHVVDVPSADLDLVVLPTGLAVLRCEGRVELFRSRPGDDDLRLVEDPAFVTGRLVDLGHQLGLLRGPCLYRATLSSGASATAS